MAKSPPRTGTAYDDEVSGTRKAWRFGIWTIVAVVAVTSAGVAAYTDGGSHLLPRTGAGQADQGRQGKFDAEMDARRVSEAVRVLAADRDRLNARLNSLERNLSDVTGSIAAGSAGPRPATGANAAGSAAAPMPSPGSAVPPASTGSLLAAPPPRPLPAPAQPNPAAASRVADPEPAPERPPMAAAAPDPGPTGSVATKTEFGIDLGVAPSLEGLRALWVSVRGTNEALFEGLRPVMNIREGAKPGTFELRLVAGPLNNAVAAARLCATLAVAGR